MPTNLLEQSARADDPRFTSQVRAVLMRELPDLLKAKPGVGVYSPGVDFNAQMQNAGKARAFATSMLPDRTGVLIQVVNLVAGQPDVLAINLNVSPTAPVTVGEIPFLSEGVIVTNTRIIIRNIAGIE